LNVPQARTVSSNIAEAETIAPSEEVLTVGRPKLEPYPEPPVKTDDYIDDSLATEVQFQKPDWEKYEVSIQSQQAPTGPLSVRPPSEEVADTRILPSYDLDLLDDPIPIDNSSSWLFTLILAIVSFAVFIIYFIFS
jgi:hypothetical protein